MNPLQIKLNIPTIHKAINIISNIWLCESIQFLALYGKNPPNILSSAAILQIFAADVPSVYGRTVADLILHVSSGLYNGELL